MADDTIIIKKVNKGRGGHHGSAWKVAYADFMTAMMAFFLLMWLLNAASKESLSGISDYFTPTALLSVSQSGAGGILGGTSLLSPGSTQATPDVIINLSRLNPGEMPDDEYPDDEQTFDKDILTDEAARELRAELEQQEFEYAENALREAIAESFELREFSENLLIDITPEGMRIQIVDVDKRSMFSSGSARMLPHTKELLGKILQAIEILPNDIAILGHTDSVPYHGDNGYSNWELSTDRANASRRTLMEAGLPESRVIRVVGMAATEPLIPENPTSPQNRRISILMLRESMVP